MSSFDFRFLNIKQIFLFSLIFILLTILGTQTHEWGHYLVGKQFGFKPLLHYASVSYQAESANDNLKYHLITQISGPVETVLTGIFGFLMLLLRRNKQKLNFSNLDWLYVFLSLFWLRQVANMFVQIFSLILFQNSFKGGDEAKISKYFNLFPASIDIVSGILGILICYYVVFLIVPKTYRLNLVLGGIFGSLAGSSIWFGFLGQTILP